ncbi:hypothetical protein HMPREF0083_05715 [Aneurinibacillus aneurinilyticus ATCC 12856]|uniref:Uncharacterized protein n=1 Tax=Aneurinibacillus aneurinilyticus ATCC 12856 TaxID=649747 RepID=U1XZC4_ANEAE|nr:hypothetical protein HMPREF0083_05715 [Aneurinibacillus aneurinilyticus ATCC 12856]
MHTTIRILQYDVRKWNYVKLSLILLKKVTLKIAFLNAKDFQYVGWCKSEMGSQI